MASIVKTVVRFGVIGGLVTGAAVLIAGPDRVLAIGEQVRGKINTAIDGTIEDPIAMRAQLRALEGQYPRRIAEVQGQLAEVHAQLKQLERDRAVAERVISLAQADYDEINGLITRAEAARAEHSGHVVAISLNDRRYDIDGAYKRASDVSQTVDLYSARLADYDQELSSLQGDQEQLATLLDKLETEHGEFQAQLANLERQIDAVSRKGKMVDLMAERQKRLDELSRYSVASLDQFKAQLTRRQAELESRLTSLSKREARSNYEDVAKVQIDRESSDRSRVERREMIKDKAGVRPAPVIEIRPTGASKECEASTASGGLAVR